MRYRVNSPQVISETLAGETIIVNLASGHYFNLQGSAVDVWEALEHGAATEAIVDHLEGRYEAADGEISGAVDKLLAELTAADLIVPLADGDGEGAGAELPPAEGERRPFATPALTAYTDMQDIILLDPVHEVDPRGWPHAPAGA
jgi:hypothetical protein